jgi:hypothetical protein
MVSASLCSQVDFGSRLNGVDRRQLFQFRSFTDMSRSSVVVYRGLGGNHILLHDCRSLADLCAAVDSRTDWLWGVGHSFVIVDLASSQLLPWEHVFSSGLLSEAGSSAHQVQIIFLPYRTTNDGFSCAGCRSFVFWDTIWFTRYDCNADRGLNYQRSFRNCRSFYCSTACGHQKFAFSADARLEPGRPSMCVV